MRKKPPALLLMIFTFVILMPVLVQAQETQSIMGSKELNDQLIEQLATDLAELSKTLEMAWHECMKQLGEEECQKLWLNYWLDICKNAEEYGLTCNIKAK